MMLIGSIKISVKFGSFQTKQLGPFRAARRLEKSLVFFREFCPDF